MQFNKMTVHQIAQFFYCKCDSSAIIVLSNSPDEIIHQYSEKENLIIVCLLDKTKYAFYDKKFNHPHIKLIQYKDFHKKLLKNSIFICEDILHSEFKLHIDKFQHFIKKAPLSILSCQSNKIKLLDNQCDWLLDKKNFLIGNTKKYLDSKIKTQKVWFGGKFINRINKSYSIKRIIAVIPHYNEKDIIESTIQHLIAQGIDVHIIDNWSTDGSFESIKKLSRKHSDRISYERFPHYKTSKYEWSKILKQVTTYAISKLDKYDWVMLNDADEIRWSPWKNINLQKAISFIDSIGFNAIDYTVLNFKATKDGFNKKYNPCSFFKYAEFGELGAYFVQVKTWRNHKQADLAASAGHKVFFPNQKTFPLKFLLSHYPLRSTEQAKSKIFKDRIPRFTNDEKLKGWHSHYNGVTHESEFVYNKSGLIKIDQDIFPEKYICELLTGVGINPNWNTQK